jgi:hypothetical protein
MTVLLPIGVLLAYALGALWFTRHVLSGVSALSLDQDRPPLAEAAVFAIDFLLVGVWPVVWAAVAILQRFRTEAS